MFLLYPVDSSKRYFAKPVMVLTMDSDTSHGKRLSVDEIIKVYSEHPENHGIVITGSDSMDHVDELREFIFICRKHFFPYTRPRIIIYTDYFMDELNKKYWRGLKCEILFYGNVLLKYGRPSQYDRRLYLNKFLGIKLVGRDQSVNCYTKMQHE